ncbi:MAG: excinuclease ABC subunit UvrC [Oscillospiraceae bacterium]|nr:excinuclease ABC subunit UvrC [Oscillospiraceae bacterium]
MTKIEELRKKAMALPEQPGVYIMKNAKSEIIYIGKAKVLKNRVSQYFGSQNNHTLKVRKMVSNVFDFDYVIVGSEFEALVLECSLIKQNKPKYNILLKDDKGYSYIKITDGEWKMFYDVKQKTDDGAKYIGPFTSGGAVTQAALQAKDIFMLPHCNKKFPQDINRSTRPCLNYYIKLCSGACKGLIGREEHNAAVDEAIEFIQGGKAKYLKEANELMQKASDELDFEKAIKLRDRIRAVERSSQRQHMVSSNCKNQDVFGIASLGNKSFVNVLCFRDGSLINTETFVIDRIEEPDEEYAELLTNYYNSQSDFPQRICIDVNLSQREFLEEYFSSLAGKKVVLYVPKAGESKTLLETAKKNASEKLSRVLSYNDKQNSVLIELKETLGLNVTPSYIEAYDISNTAGQENVAGMVVFKDGKPLKRCYRRFAIKSFEGQDDYRSLAEVLERRIKEYNKPDNSDKTEGFGKKPDLILLDGGIGQVNAVKPIFESMNFDVPLFGMVKDGKHRTRAIAAGNGEIMINDKRSVFSFVSSIQEEVHRYAINYHRTLKKKNTLEITLTSIEGIGKQRAKLLLARFKTLDAIKSAELDELLSVAGLTQTAAKSVYEHFHKPE